MKDDENKKALLSINKSSLFLKKIIESKERERFTSKKIFEKNNKKSNIRAQKISDDNKKRMYQSPLNNQQTTNNLKNEILNKRYELYLDNYLKKIN